MIYGYCRATGKNQRVETQAQAILKAYPEAMIINEPYTGLSDNTDIMKRLLAVIKPGETFICENPEKIADNSDEAYAIYKELYDRNVNIVFLKTPYLNSSTYQNAIQAFFEKNKDNNTLREIISDCERILTKSQFDIVFSLSKEAHEMYSRKIKEGIQLAKIKGIKKKVLNEESSPEKSDQGTAHRKKPHIKKEGPAKEFIRNNSDTFGGSMKNDECIQKSGLSKNTFFKYKKEILQELLLEQSMKKPD